MEHLEVLAGIRRSQLHDLTHLGWRLSDRSSIDDIIASFRKIFERACSDPAQPEAIGALVWSGIALLTYGELQPLFEVLRAIEGYPRRIYWRQAQHYVSTIAMLVPFPEGISPLENPVVARRWLAENDYRLKWDETTGLYSLTSMNLANHYVSRCCIGERCRICGQPAPHKVEEVIFEDDPTRPRHPFTTYLCCAHFALVMGNAVPCDTRSNDKTT
jgi:hypothetical protein